MGYIFSFSYFSILLNFVVGPWQLSQSQLCTMYIVGVAPVRQK